MRGRRRASNRNKRAWIKMSRFKEARCDRMRLYRKWANTTKNDVWKLNERIKSSVCVSTRGSWEDSRSFMRDHNRRSVQSSFSWVLFKIQWMHSLSCLFIVLEAAGITSINLWRTLIINSPQVSQFEQPSTAAQAKRTLLFWSSKLPSNPRKMSSVTVDQAAFQLSPGEITRKRVVTAWASASPAVIRQQLEMTRFVIAAEGRGSAVHRTVWRSEGKGMRESVWWNWESRFLRREGSEVREYLSSNWR